MYWTQRDDLVDGGLTVRVDADRVPGLVLESSPRRRLLRLRAHEERLLWARIEREYYGVWVLRRSTSASPSIVPPIRAREARELDRTDAWMRFFARALDRSPRSPLRPGTWQLTELCPPKPGARGDAATFASVDCEIFPPGTVQDPLQAATFPRLAHERWGVRAPYRVAPLRGFSAPDASRVKAWRKHARDETLPPVLLWLVHALEMLVIIDGHDRLSAAIAERVLPKVIVVWELHDRPSRGDRARREHIAEGYARAHERSDALSERTRRALNDALIRAFRRSCYSTTTARATPNLDSEWFREVRAELQGDESEDAEEMQAIP